MNDTLLIFIAVIGGGAGLAIVGVALWIMRQDDQAARKKTADGAPAEPADPPAVIPSDETVTVSGGQDSPIAPETPPAPDRAPAETAALPPAAASAPVPSLPVVVNSATTGAPALDGDGQEVLRLLRTSEGALIVAVNGRRYRQRGDITDSMAEQQILNASQDLQAFLGAGTAPAPLPPLAAPAKTPDAAETRGVVKVTLEEAAQMEMKPPSMDIVRQWRYVRDQQRKPQVQIKTVMDEIDEILQVMLIGTPIAGRGLRATDGAHGAVFTLDGRNYDSVDELPDAQARDLVRSAIQKWDQKR